MSGWAQREAERKEDEANEMDELITEVRELHTKLSAVITERDALRAELARLQRNEDCVQRLIVWATENGWNGVDNSKILDVFISGLFDQLRAELAAAKEERDRQYEYNAGAIAKFAALELERDQLAAHVERLEKGLRVARELTREEPDIYVVGIRRVIDELLAATPAQSLAAHDAALLRKVAKKHAYRRNDGDWTIHPDSLTDEADRIEQEAANG